MNACIDTAVRRAAAAALLVAGLAAPTAAPASPPLLPPVQATLYAFDCVERVPPTQREVGEWTGQHNLGQVYATRQRLMSDVARACLRPGVGEVLLVNDPGREAPAGQRDHMVAVLALPRR